MALTPNTQSQIPENSILDLNNKQAYLGNQFVSGPDTFSLADSSEHPILYISNPSTNSKALFIYNIDLNAIGSTDIITFRLYSNPTGVSGGTAVTPRNCRPASANTSVATVKSGPTVSGNGTRLQTIALGFNAQSIVNPIIILDPGQSFLITGQATTTATAICQSVHYEI
jgi:hypothetical protein